MTKTDAAFEIAGNARSGNVVVTCDHASNAVPRAIHGGSLGLSQTQMERHIAFDVGTAAVARRLGERLDAPVALSRFSRLVIDPNRGEDDPTLIMQIYDGTIIPGNRHLDKADIAWRLENCYHPYHAALAHLLASRENPILIAVHSFTARLNGHPRRPWHIGILHGKDKRLGIPMLQALRCEPDLCVGENEPYGGHLDGDSIDRHAIRHGRANILIELRNDLIRTPERQTAWADRLAPIIRGVIAKTPL